MPYFDDPAYGYNQPQYDGKAQLSGILGGMSQGGVLGGPQPSSFVPFGQPSPPRPGPLSSIGLALVAGLAGGRDMQSGLAEAGQNAQYVRAKLQDDDQKHAINDWLKAGAPKDVQHPAVINLFKHAPKLAEAYIGQQLAIGKQREIRNDPNGIPRYTDSGQEVFPGVKARGGPEGIFAGKSVMAQGLNWLIANNKITEEQASELASSKQVTGEDGTVYLMTPQGIFGQAPGEQAQPLDPNAEPTQDGSPAPSGVPAGAIPLTGAKSFGGDEQTKAAGFAKRVQNANAVLQKPGVADAGSSYWQHAKSGIPLGLGNYAVSEDYQLYDQASRDLINAILRRESGAAISESEFENARQQYLPQPGDTKAKLDQKAANRQQAVENLTRSAGPLNQGFVKGSSKEPKVFNWHPDTGLTPK